MAKDTPFDRARDFVEEKIDQTKEVLDQTKEVLGESYTKAREQFDDVSKDVRKGAKTAARQMEKNYGDIWTETRRYVRDNPGTALAISLGVGLLLGFLIRGGDD